MRGKAVQVVIGRVVVMLGRRNMSVEMHLSMRMRGDGNKRSGSEKIHDDSLGFGCKICWETRRG